MRWRVLAVLLSAAIPCVGGAQAPNTDIFLAPLTRAGGALVVGPALNVTHRVGYDNQPSFLPDGSAILYTAVDSGGQADIWRYDIASRRTSRVTATPESEYSATVMPGGGRFSVIRVERDSAQRLWSFSLDGSDPRLVLATLKPIGYHAWLDSARLVTYVLGTPSTLHVVSRDGAADEIRAHDIGRAVHRVPAREAYTFTQRDSAKALWITMQPIAGGPAERVIRAAPDNEFHVWTPSGELLTASRGILLRWNGERGDQSAWIPLADLTTNGVKNVSRLAVSPDGRWLAFVAEPSAP
jgi:dipeptidyl aminopeptidase/acylaminoacyl peptidase